MATPSKCTPHVAALTTYFILLGNNPPSRSIRLHTSTFLHVFSSSVMPALLPLEATTQIPRAPFALHTSPAAFQANSVTSVSPCHSRLFIVFHSSFGPSRTLVTPANPTCSQPPTRATFWFCCNHTVVDA